jgi:hypothetical protein
MALSGASAPKPPGWHPDRRAQPINQPLPAAVKWVDSLPPEFRPSATLRDYPRIVNALARAWADRDAFSAYLDSLLADRRGGRRGFPGDVHHELVCLRGYCEGRYPSAPTN